MLLKCYHCIDAFVLELKELVLQILNLFLRILFFFFSIVKLLPKIDFYFSKSVLQSESLQIFTLPASDPNDLVSDVLDKVEELLQCMVCIGH